MNHTVFLNKDIEVLVVSAGGVGTTFLMQEIGKYKNVNDASNRDGFKHLPIPPVSFNPGLRVIYVFGNPITACMSLFRRNYQETQSYQMQQYYPKNYQVKKSSSLAEYAEKGQDGFHFQRHFDNWSKHFLVYPTLFLRYETLFEHLEDIVRFLELPNAFITNFPEKAERLSQVTDLDHKTLEKLENLYGNLSNLFLELPSVFIKKGKDLKGFSVFFSTPYYRGLNKFLWKKMPFLRRLKNWGQKKLGRF